MIRCISEKNLQKPYKNKDLTRSSHDRNLKIRVNSIREGRKYNPAPKIRRYSTQVLHRDKNPNAKVNPAYPGDPRRWRKPTSDINKIATTPEECKTEMPHNPTRFDFHQEPKAKLIFMTISHFLYTSWY